MTCEGGECPIVKTSYGPVCGVSSGGVQRFLGLRYAAPPVGKLRWLPPVKPESWTTPYDATRFGARYAQPPSDIGFSRQSNTEDCLFLNIFAPDAEAALKRPVIVWFPGGGWVWGAGDDYDPEYFVLDHGVVFVTLNYRVGLFGFFSHPEINAEGHANGNYGYMDQRLALHWVQDNIIAFGGDPDNVTIAGESAGGGSVMAHLASPGSKGLFHRAIIESHWPHNNPTLAEYENLGRSFAQAAGCEDQSSQCLRALTPDQILAVNTCKTGRVAGVPTTEEMLGRFTMGPMIDGDFMPRGILDAISAGEFARVPIIIGTTRDEMTLFTAGLERTRGAVIPPDDYETVLRNNFGDKWSKVAERYRLESFDTAGQALGTALGDAGMISGMLRGADLISRQWPDVYLYEFNVRDAPIPYPPYKYSLRAYHTAELPFLFKRWHGAIGTPQALSEDQQKLSRSMVLYWCNFAATGSPNGLRNNAVPVWERLDPTKQNYLSFEAPIPKIAEDFGGRHHYDYWVMATSRGSKTPEPDSSI